MSLPVEDIPTCVDVTTSPTKNYIYDISFCFSQSFQIHCALLHATKSWTLLHLGRMELERPINMEFIVDLCRSLLLYFHPNMLSSIKTVVLVADDLMYSHN